MHRLKCFRSFVLLVAFVALGGYALPVSARTISAASGIAVIGADTAAFNAPNGFVYNTGTLGKPFIMPITFDSTGARTIKVRGKAATNGSLSCQAVVVKTDGTIASSSTTAQFPKNNAYTSVDLSVSSVPAGAVGVVGCTLSGQSTSVLLGIDYTP